MTYAFARIGAVVAMKVEDYYPVTTTPDGQAFFASLAGNYRAQRPSRAGPSRHRPRRRELPADRSHRVQQVEDQLAGLRILAQQAEVQDKAVAAAFEAARIINHQYLAGTVAYTSVIVADQTALANAETAVNIGQSRLVASAALIQALGGGWDTTQLPSRERIEEKRPAQL
jgi:hypothetical protein